MITDNLHKMQTLGNDLNIYESNFCFLKTFLTKHFIVSSDFGQVFKNKLTKTTIFILFVFSFLSGEIMD